MILLLQMNMQIKLLQYDIANQYHDLALILILIPMCIPTNPGQEKSKPA